ncbi:hypothetical protein DL240_14365 [Lujinxingia litoralis]|uniref:Uncharacterized protein n=1 Tax=Lujinxingia litoralis TaxID=2211119 RepID=A0A328C4Y0_9DELT|nr:hypothetical protein DL240_14365 [Lujinxingia litoralis]
MSGHNHRLHIPTLRKIQRCGDVPQGCPARPISRRRQRRHIDHIVTIACTQPRNLGLIAYPVPGFPLATQAHSQVAGPAGRLRSHPGDAIARPAVQRLTTTIIHQATGIRRAAIDCRLANLFALPAVQHLPTAIIYQTTGIHRTALDCRLANLFALPTVQSLTTAIVHQTAGILRAAIDCRLTDLFALPTVQSLATAIIHQTAGILRAAIDCRLTDFAIIRLPDVIRFPDIIQPPDIIHSPDIGLALCNRRPLAIAPRTARGDHKRPNHHPHMYTSYHPILLKVDQD